MGMMLVERHQASFFGKLLESCRATKGRDSTPTDEARRSLARWARTAGHARPIMQRRGQTGAGFRFLPEAKGRDRGFLRDRRRKPRSRAAGGRGKPAPVEYMGRFLPRPPAVRDHGFRLLSRRNLKSPAPWPRVRT